MATKKQPYKQQNIQLPKEFEGGRVPPQALDSEEAVLGAVMVEKDAFLVVSDLLKPESFYSEANQTIFKAICELAKGLHPIDLYTVTEQLRASGELQNVGGPAYLAQLTQKVASAAHLEYYAKIVVQKFVQRQLLQASGNIQNKAFDDQDDIEELINYSEQQIFDIAEGNLRNATRPLSEIVKTAMDNIAQAAERPEGLSGVPSGFTKLDSITSGWQKTDLIVVAARPAMGKTAFVLSMARNMAVEHGVAVAMFSLEMSSVQLVTRLLVAESEIKGEDLRNGRLTQEQWDNLNDKVAKLSKAKIFLDETPGISVFELRAKCRRLVEHEHVQIILIDYLQLMTTNLDVRSGNREQEVSLISRSLKAIAKELNVPIIVLSQLNRSTETRGGNKRPQLSDLRESGAIEQDADIVIMIHRPEYYGITEYEDNHESTIGKADIIVAKHRNGRTDEVRLNFSGEFARFSDSNDPQGVSLQNPHFNMPIPSKMNSMDLSSELISAPDETNLKATDNDVPF